MFYNIPTGFRWLCTNGHVVGTLKRDIAFGDLLSIADVEWEGAPPEPGAGFQDITCHVCGQPLARPR